MLSVRGRIGCAVFGDLLFNPSRFAAAFLLVFLMAGGAFVSFNTNTLISPQYADAGSSVSFVFNTTKFFFGSGFSPPLRSIYISAPGGFSLSPSSISCISSNGTVWAVASSNDSALRCSDPSGLSDGQSIIVSFSASTAGCGQHYWQVNAREKEDGSNSGSVDDKAYGSAVCPASPALAISLISPADSGFSASASPVFNWSANYNGTACNLSINSSAVQTGITGTAGAFSVPSPVSLPDGSHSWQVFCSNGNLTESSASNSFTVDTIAPALLNASIMSNGTTPIYPDLGDELTVSFTFSEPVYIGTVTINGISALVSPIKLDTVFTASRVVLFNETEGNVSFAIFDFYDEAGNPSGTNNATSDGSYVIIDRTVPTANITYLPSTPTSGNVTATLVPNEPVTVTNNNGSNTFTFAGNGNFTFEFADASGNTGTAIAEVSSIDTLAPSLNVSSPVNGSTLTSPSFDLNFTATDSNPGSCWYSLDSFGTFALPSCTNTTINADGSLNLSDGTHTLIIFANDSFGHESNHSITFTIDTPPSLSLLAPAAGATGASTNPTFSWGASDGTSATVFCTLFIDGAANKANLSVASGVQFNTTASAAFGFSTSHNWSVSCTDGFGNVATPTPATRSFIVGSAPPAPPAPPSNSGGGSNNNGGGSFAVPIPAPRPVAPVEITPEPAATPTPAPAPTPAPQPAPSSATGTPSGTSAAAPTPTPLINPEAAGQPATPAVAASLFDTASASPLLVPLGLLLLFVLFLLLFYFFVLRRKKRGLEK